MAPKPDTCRPCPLYELGEGFVPAVGPKDAKILFLLEAPGENEALRSTPLVGATGAIYDRMLTKIQLQRPSVRIANTIQCRPPKNKIDGWYIEEAVKVCSQYVDPVLAGAHNLVIPMGGTAIRKLLGFPIKPKQRSRVRVQDFHGQPVQDSEGRWIVPNFHPAVLLRKSGLWGTVANDLLKALEIQKNGWTYDIPELVIDPPEDWFDEWVDSVLATIGTPEEPWIPVDVENPEKGEDEGDVDLGVLLNASHISAHITRVNVSCSTKQGVTVPFKGRYISALRRLVASALVKICWNKRHDAPRMDINGCPMAEPVYDMMDAWHVLQSDQPKGLGFVAPFYSKAPAWKHLATIEPGTYGAMDGVQEQRVAVGVAQHLVQYGLWNVFERHCWFFDVACLYPAERVGLKADRPALEAFHQELLADLTVMDAELQALYPARLKKLDPKLGLASRPDYFDVVEKTVSTSVRVCRTCKAVGVAVKHRCKEPGKKPGTMRPSKTMVAQLEDVVMGVPRYYRRQPFNPGSWQQVLAYVKDKGHQPGEGQKGGESVDKHALARLLVETGDRFYELLDERRQTDKVKGTYVEATLKRLDGDDRVHTQFLHRPSTLRLSSVGPNLQNVAAGRDDREVAKKLANRYRSCIIAAPGHVLMEIDFSAIEAVLVGWFAADPAYIRMAKLGVHAWLCSQVLGKPPDPRWDDKRTGEYFKGLKDREQALYDACKRVVHGSNYLMSPYGMVENYPKIFHTQKEARKIQDLYFSIAPRVRQWQLQVQRVADQRHWLGGPGQAIPGRPDSGHPFGYKHWFWAVKERRRSTRGGGESWYEAEGPDAKRCVAFPPQSTARGVLTESLLRLHDPEGENWIGDTYHGETPLRAPIHDSGLFEVPEGLLHPVLLACWAEFTRPITQLPCPKEWGFGPYLTIGVEAKVGVNWGPHSEANPHGMRKVPPEELGVAADTTVIEEEEDEEVEVA